MHHVSVICPRCKELVPVIEKTIQEHGDCPAGGMRYIPSPTRVKAYAGGPEFEVVAAKPLTGRCEDCHSEHVIGLAALVNVKVPNPTVN